MFDEMVDLLAPDDPSLPTALCTAGFSRFFRYQCGGDDKDRDAAVTLIERGRGGPGVSTAIAAQARLVLGMLYFARGAGPLDRLAGPSALQIFHRGAGTAADLDRAERLLREVAADAAVVGPGFAAQAGLMVDMFDVVRAIGAGGFPDAATMMKAMSLAQRMQTHKTDLGTNPMMLSPEGMRSIVEGSPLLQVPAVIEDIAVVEGGNAPESKAQSLLAVAAPEPVASPTAVQLRREVRERLGLAPGMPVWDAAAALLLPDTALPETAAVDDSVALAVVLHEVGRDGSDAEVAVDTFLLAVALHLRERVEGDGVDRRAGAEALLDSAGKVSADHPAAPVILCSLAAFLDPDHPVTGLRGIAAGLVARFDAVLASDAGLDPDQRAVLRALRALCRTAWAAEEFEKARTRVPDGHPYARVLRSASPVVGGGHPVVRGAIRHSGRR
ncbi:hypothetical protein [Actinokineospora sp. 24-640]